MDAPPHHPQPGQAVETRDFYILAAIKERWPKRELERQIRSGAVLREALATKKVSFHSETLFAHIS